MAIKVVKPGPDVSAKVYKATCQLCESTVRFLGADAFDRLDGSGRAIKQIGCPVCYQDIRVPR